MARVAPRGAPLNVCVMPTRTRAAPTTKAAIVAVIVAMSPGVRSDAPPTATVIDRAEAQALVAVVPEVRNSVAAGQKVNFFDIDIGKFNTAAYFGFFVSVPSEISSGLIGRYAVNKKTADVWDVTLIALVRCSAIEAQQRKIRQKHHISVEVINRYRDAPVLMFENSSGHNVGPEDRPDAESRHNMPIKLPVRAVTPLASASVAPVRPAAYRQRYTD